MMYAANSPRSPERGPPIGDGGYVEDQKMLSVDSVTL
ncbi:hypothetical protein Poly41_27280 [Novipirellula artificiosorum]|uniref:Uncharacterized protein n=1 Tax=Novipirellula artificiosorum TaxID=2528016 RepID=A0A5C6DNR7_9BACT|nr:hypothetical protein Poly41_27280 [Novipirellula artificiosorum]